VESPVAVTSAQQGSNLRQSLTERGVILMKESRPIAYVATLYGPSIEVAGHILVRLRNSIRHIFYGVRLQYAETDTHASAAFIDSDEIDELLGAVDFIVTSADRMAHDRRDYTEVSYSTNDHVTFGFYQQDSKQQAFVRFDGRLIHIGIEKLPILRSSIADARAHADTRKIAWESR